MVHFSDLIKLAMDVVNNKDSFKYLNIFNYNFITADLID